MPDLDFGLCARVSLRFGPILRPRFHFQIAQRFPVPKHVTSGSMSPRSLFPTRQRFPIPKHVTSGLNHVTSGDVISGSGDVIVLLSTNQKPPFGPYGPTLLLISTTQSHFDDESVW